MKQRKSRKTSPKGRLKSTKWFWTFVIATALALGTYGANLVLAEINPGNPWGMGYGTAALVLMCGAAYYGIHRRFIRIASKLRLGSSRNWLQFHIYGGSLFLICTLMHTGFSLPSGPLNWWLWLLSLWVVLSGLLGVVLQKWIPKILSSGLAVETVYERIPELVEECRAKADVIMATASAQVNEFFGKNMAPTLAKPNTNLIYFLDITGGIQSEINKFAYFKSFMPDSEKQKLDGLQAIYQTKLELDAHYTLQKALRWWLVVHLPPSMVLLVLVGIHLYSVFYY